MPPRSVASDFASGPPLTQVVILQMGHLAYMANRCRSKLEATVPGMIQRALTAVVKPFREPIDAFAARIEVCEKGQGATSEMTAQKATISKLRKDVDHLKSTYTLIIFGTVEIPTMPTDSDVPPATTRDEV
ncbi:uncharacterized protein LOC125870126 [Solanum stenotomum]|uniref:uncharacterized protein LOC125870126 n=1 Tax=Solanum stenotomum TaxID=172797 RepID=UPI0020D00974|nr:uncharacterized protein LOC125870126 [Solanum stenotomum]